ncbi:PHD finger protein 20-like protein 1 [Dissostichus eleginoides]|uniref:PHD finger protein 20-like protein 1 n=1 Tax=Dissostichus eleginoides TaxID=100907 RepID=A0AAD9FGK1_DISEL|nr:PHD finger protein 20-like protein 1 [Dissostichus eleginoides]
MKTPPDRSGITFEVGAQLEARDRHKKWYAATIEEIDFEKERIQVHFRKWSRRHNEWFHWTSPYLRPLERTFVSGTKVLACWTDCRFYPAKILRVNKDDSYKVRFYDGVVLTVKPTKIKPFKEVEAVELRVSQSQLTPPPLLPLTPPPATETSCWSVSPTCPPLTDSAESHNQPPPILSIELDHNPFKCPSAGCMKSFRKASLLHYHIKYYHSDQHLDEQLGEQLEPPRRKRSSSQGRDFLSERKSEDQHSICHLSQDTAAVTKRTRTALGSHGRRQRLVHADGRERGGHFSWPVAMETEECEVVRCVCEVDEENDFMIQCESCLCWQHGTCMGLYEDNVPLNYTCYYCRHTAGWRRAQRFLSEPDLLISGHMFGLSCVKENYSEVNASKISHTSSLLAHTHGLNQVLRGLQLKVSLLHSPSHPDLQLWRLPWRREEGSRSASSPRGETSICYVSSEHCYQKPGASWEKSEERDKETQTVVVKLEQEIIAGFSVSFLGHMTHVSVSAVLESWLDHSGELEPPDPLSRLPQLKQRIRRLLRDLCTVRHLSVWR